MATSRVIDTSPFWMDDDSLPMWAPLDDDDRVDVVVVGGGVAGLTAAYLLAKAGVSVAVVERGRCAQADTGHTTAHLTMVTDTRLQELVSRCGRDHAQATWDAGLAAIAQVDAIIHHEQIACGFEWVDGILHAPRGSDDPEEVRRLEADTALATEMGFDAEFMSDVPVMGRPGIRFAGQARMHPRQYLAGVARAIVAAGGRIYEQSNADAFHDDPRSVTVNGYTLSCENIVLATHNPRVGLEGTASATLFQTKLALYTSYVVAARVPHGQLPDALWWDTSDPYQYLRLAPGDDHDVVILGGEDHKTGQASDTNQCYARLEQALSTLLPEAALTHRWSGQVIGTPDGLPFIGATAAHQYAATGFAGNGMTFGTLGAMLISDAILRRANPWTDLFAPDRPAVRRGVWEYLKENADYPYYMMRRRFAGTSSRPLRSVTRGEGQVLLHNGVKVAAYRDDTGALTVTSAVCTHMGCVVAWNDAERTWDCPCHGSRFTTSGEVLSGPAESPLEPVDGLP